MSKVTQKSVVEQELELRSLKTSAGALTMLPLKFSKFVRLVASSNGFLSSSQTNAYVKVHGRASPSNEVLMISCTPTKKSMKPSWRHKYPTQFLLCEWANL